MWCVHKRRRLCRRLFASSAFPITHSTAATSLRLAALLASISIARECRRRRYRCRRTHRFDRSRLRQPRRDHRARHRAVWRRRHGPPLWLFARAVHVAHVTVRCRRCRPCRRLALALALPPLLTCCWVGCPSFIRAACFLCALVRACAARRARVPPPTRLPLQRSKIGASFGERGLSGSLPRERECAPPHPQTGFCLPALILLALRTPRVQSATSHSSSTSNSTEIS